MKLYDVKFRDFVVAIAAAAATVDLVVDVLDDFAAFVVEVLMMLEQLCIFVVLTTSSSFVAADVLVHFLVVPIGAVAIVFFLLLLLLLLLLLSPSTTSQPSQDDTHWNCGTADVLTKDDSLMELKTVARTVILVTEKISRRVWLVSVHFIWTKDLRLCDKFIVCTGSLLATVFSSVRD